MNLKSDILGKLKYCIIIVLLGVLGLGTFSSYMYFKGVFAKNMLGSVRSVSDGLDEKLKTREGQYLVRKQNNESAYLARLNHNLGVLQNSLVGSLWTVEQENAQSVLKAFLQMEEISAIRVDDESGQIFAAMQKKDGKVELVSDDKSFQPTGKLLVGDVVRGDKKLGVVKLYYTEEPLQQQQVQVDNDLARFHDENSTLAGSINLNLSDAIEKQTKQVVLRRVVEMVAAFVLMVLMLTLFIRLYVKKPLTELLRSLSVSSAEIKSAAAQVANNAEMLATATAQEAASVEETSATVVQLSAATQGNAEHAKQTDRLVGETHTMVDRASQSLGELFDLIQQIKQSSAATSTIIKTIDEISFQTNILALNAAVEAARAGEHGLGFAVVAGEVRTLAMRAAKAAKDTSDLIENTNRQVARSASMVEETRRSFEEVNVRVNQSSKFVTQIAEASATQAQGIEQLKIAIATVDKVLQQNAASAQESAAAAQQMRAQCETVNRVIDELRVMVGVEGVAENASDTACESATFWHGNGSETHLSTSRLPKAARCRPGHHEESLASRLESA
ncbi:MAG TPA: methyl-accepting chemotaxis protein, partial [Verrucomicrobiae bacterium]